MLRTTVHATEETDVDAAIYALITKCERARLSPQDTTAIANQFESTLRSLVERGRSLGSSGTQMQVTREISGERYSIRIIFRTGHHKGLFQRIIDVFRRNV